MTTDEAIERQETNLKCPCRLRNYMELEDCDKADCTKCCPVAMLQQETEVPARNIPPPAERGRR